MNFFITGGSGFIGRYFVHTLLASGHEVTVYDLHPFEEGVPEIDASNVTYIRGDVRDLTLLEQSMKGCDAVLHLAAAHHDFGISEETFDDVNVQGARCVCQAMTQNGISDACFYSTVAIYGETKPPVDEESSQDAVLPYGKTKREAEKVFREWVDADADGSVGRRCLTIRPTVTFGMGNFANMFMLIKQIDSNRFLPVGAGTNIKSMSYVENIVDAVLTLWLSPNQDRPKYAPFNYVCLPDMNSGDIARIVYDELGKAKPKIAVPYWLARVLVFPLDLVVAVTGKNLPVTGARIKKMAKSQTKYESKRIRDAGFEQKISLEEGIRKMVRWYVERGKDEASKGIKRRLPPATAKMGSSFDTQTQTENS